MPTDALLDCDGEDITIFKNFREYWPTDLTNTPLSVWFLMEWLFVLGVISDT